MNEHSMRVIALNTRERKAVHELLIEAIKAGKDEDGMLLGVAETMLQPPTVREVWEMGLGDER